MMKSKTEECQHRFSSLGFNVYKVTDNSVEAVAAIHCTICGMFRTKILTFRREIQNDNLGADEDR